MTPKIPKLKKRTTKDPYQWVHNDSALKELKLHLKDEAQYAEAMLRPLKELKSQIHQELIERLPEENISPFLAIDDYLYFTKTFVSKDYPVLYRKTKAEEAEELVMDFNDLKKNIDDSISLEDWQISKDHKYLAFSVDFEGFESFQIMIYDILNREYVDKPIEATSGTFEWCQIKSHTAVHHGIIYVGCDSHFRPNLVKLHELFQFEPKDFVLLEEHDPQCFVDLYMSEDESAILITSEGPDANAVWFIPSYIDKQDVTLLFANDTKTHRIVSVAKKTGEEANEYDLWFFEKSYGKDYNLFRGFCTETTGIHHASIALIAKPDKDHYFEDFSIFKNFLTLEQRTLKNGSIVVFDLTTLESYKLAEDYLIAELFHCDGSDFEQNILRYGVSHLSLPQQTFEYDLKRRIKTLIKSEEVKNFDPLNYETLYVEVPSHDGTLIPISYIKSKKHNIHHGVYLTGYGAYGDRLDYLFSSEMIPLVDRGIIFAQAHVRGGGEKGEAWHLGGKLELKKNSFHDFLACGEYFANLPTVTHNKILAAGDSAGGLLIGACLNMKPHLFCGAITQVPFVDVVNSMLDEDQQLTPTEWSEWGNPENKPQLKYMMSYSPYENVKAKKYPTILISTSTNDTRVSYLEALKWAAALRTHTTGEDPIILNIREGVGHGGHAGLSQYYEEKSWELAFVVKQLLNS